MTVILSSISAIHLLDSRGRPTLRVLATLSDGRSVRSGVPSGASTGSRRGCRAARPRPEALLGAGRAASGCPRQRTDCRRRDRSFVRLA